MTDDSPNVRDSRMAPLAIDRRALLHWGALAGALPCLPAPGLFPRSRPLFGHKTQRAILVAFAGGLRTRETLDSPENVPNLLRMAETGVVYPKVRTSNLGHYGASLSIFTGVAEARGIRDNERGEDPTLFEYLRKDLDLKPGAVWIATSGGAQQSNYSYSTHRDYGARFGANQLDGDGIFNAEFKQVLKAYGRPEEWSAKERNLLERMRSGIRTEASGGVNNAESSARVERYILDELTRGTVDMRGTGASDAKALRVARNLMAVFQPTLLAVALRDADVAHRSFNAYVEVIRRNDKMLGELFDAVQADPGLRESTAIFVLPEFGRDMDLNTRRGLDHGDNSDDLNLVSMVAWGPDFRRGATVNQEVRSIDVTPSLCDLLGARARFARGKKLPGLLR